MLSHTEIEESGGGPLGGRGSVYLGLDGAGSFHGNLKKIMKKTILYVELWS